MKKSSFFISSMMALTCEFGLTACSSANEEVVDNPNYDPVTKTVNANFVFSVSTGNTSSAITRQSSATTQATLGEVFRGIGTSQLFAFLIHLMRSNAFSTGWNAAVSPTSCLSLRSISS